MMPEGDRLGRLQMREARHDRCRVRLGLADERQLQRRQRFVEAVEALTHVQPEVGRHLVVARARRVQAPGRSADHFLEPAFDVHVHVFEGAREHHLAARDLRGDLIEAFDDRLRIGLVDDARVRQHGRMRPRGADVLRGQTLVEADGGVYLLHDLCGRG